MRLKSEVTFPKELKDEPIICYLCKQFDITLNIIEASFSTEIGWAILILEGSEEQIKRVFEYLKDKGAEVENIQETS